MNDWKILEKHAEAINRIAGPSGYQRFEGKHAPILKQCMPYVSHVAGLKVLDAGCSYGLLSLVASRHCPEVVGVEIGKDSYELGVKIYEHLKQVGLPEYNIDRIKMLNCSLSEVDIDEKFEGVMAYNILYHLHAKDLDKMTAIISECSKIVVQSKKKAGRWTNRLHLPDRILKYLSDMGFQCEVKEERSPRPIILGSRK